jgi:DNA (cytosine-5)-methyltransferase 1
MAKGSKGGDMEHKFNFYEFFAGVGMARAGLGEKWECGFANDVAAVKVAAYTAKWGAEHLDTRDVNELSIDDLPGRADLAWASFPCQDVSVAGAGLGIGRAAGGKLATRSGALWPFLSLIEELRVERRKPSILVLENVAGLLTSNSGKDFRSICTSLNELGYVFGALVVDAKHFLPQSRPRVFILGVSSSIRIPKQLRSSAPLAPWHTAGVVRAFEGLTDELVGGWRWWSPGAPPLLPADALASAVTVDSSAEWHSATETKRLIAMMSAANLDRLKVAKRSGALAIGSLYLRMRPDEGQNVQRAEISFGPTLGCLRTPRGGGSRPRIIVVDGNCVKTRLLSAREAATLMGLSADFPLPERYEHAFRVIGDGVATPVVRFLAETLIEPLIASHRRARKSKGRSKPSPRATVRAV